MNLTFEDNFTSVTKDRILLIDTNVIIQLAREENKQGVFEVLQRLANVPIQSMVTLDLCIYEYLRVCTSAQIRDEKKKFIMETLIKIFGIKVLKTNDVVNADSIMSTAILGKGQISENIPLIDIILTNLLIDNKNSMLLLTKDEADFNNDLTSIVSSIFFKKKLRKGYLFEKLHLVGVDKIK